jgi:predicted TPR repeat methyltransferase
MVFKRMSGTHYNFLDRAYELDTAQATHAFYKDWAASYDAEILANGYVTPQRCAKALRSAVSAPTSTLLDLGCGTGLSGQAFLDVGFETIDGSDFSQAMLDAAASKQRIYRELLIGDLMNPIPAKRGEYANIAAVGVFSPGHAPALMIETVISRLEPGGCFVFSLNDHALADPSYDATIDELLARGVAEMASREYGDHLPKQSLNADICVLRAL